MLLPLDQTNIRAGTNVDMHAFWQIIFMSSLFMCVVLLPFGYFFYETAEDLDYKSRFCYAFRNEILLIIIFSLIHFPMFGTMRTALIPVESLAYKGFEGINTATDAAKINSVFLSLEDPTLKMSEDKNVY